MKNNCCKDPEETQKNVLDKKDYWFKKHVEHTNTAMYR
jgi:hypothetical protein